MNELEVAWEEVTENHDGFVMFMLRFEHDRSDDVRKPHPNYKRYAIDFPITRFIRSGIGRPTVMYMVEQKNFYIFKGEAVKLYYHLTYESPPRFSFRSDISGANNDWGFFRQVDAKEAHTHSVYFHNTDKNTWWVCTKNELTTT